MSAVRIRPGAPNIFNMSKTATIIFDLDGTVVDSPDHQEPTQRLVNAIQVAENTYNLCAATGRPWSSAKPIIQALLLKDPCIVSAGTQIRDAATEQVLWQCDIEPSHLEQIVEVCKQYAQYKILYNDFDQETYFNSNSMPLDNILRSPVYSLGIIFVPETKAADIIASFAHMQGVACTLALAQKPGYNDILITNKYATKEHAIAKLLEIVGVERQDTIGIGDGHNDINLFQAVQRKIAMGNAVQELKKMSDEVIGGVSDDGMAEYLEQLVKF